MEPKRTKKLDKIHRAFVFTKPLSLIGNGPFMVQGLNKIYEDFKLSKKHKFDIFPAECDLE